MEKPTQIADAQTIEEKINTLAAQIIQDSADQNPLFVALLRGAAPFASKLMFAITRQAPDFHPEIDYMMISTYGTERSAGTPQVVTDLAPSTQVEGRHVIVLDDVLDKGITADFVAQYLRQKGAVHVKLAVLVDKQTERLKPVVADYACLAVEDAWLAGMGMDDPGTAHEGYRWSDAIFRIN